MLITIMNTAAEPILAAKAIAHGLVRIIDPEKDCPRSNTKATIRLAPELNPNTSGPAKGFLKRVCINKPLTDKEAPARIHVIAFGKRNCQMIALKVESSALPVKARTNSVNGIFTLPIEMLAIKRRSKLPVRIKMGFLKSDCFIHKSYSKQRK
jgi:hypothetical protein